MRGSLLFAFAFLLGVGKVGVAQDVVSASSGVVQYFEGAVLLDDKPIEHKTAVFPSLKNGTTLHTGKGRAELLLTPSVYLRLDENTTLRMVSNSLTDTRLEITDGSAILDNLNATPSRAVVLTYHDSAVHFPKAGIYRVDCELGELQVYSGEAEVTHEKTSSTIDSSHLYYFALDLSTSKFGDGAMDEFYDWARNRSDVIAEQNQTASAEQDEAQDPDPTGAAGAFVIPPSYTPPSYSVPSSPLYGTSPYALGNPYYVNPPSPFLGFWSSPAIVVVTPFRHRPGGTHWPTGTIVGSGLGYRPGSVVTRWPVTGQSGSYVPGTRHYPVGSTYRPAGSLAARPVISSMPRPATSVVVPHMTTAPHVAAPHVAAPHMGAIGHR